MKLAIRTANDANEASRSIHRALLRTLGTLAAVGSASLLVIAACLEPNTSGLGTHHQLGLPPCTIRVLFGIRCPSCGMTTSWAHFMNGDLASAARANLGGLLLAVAAVGSLALTIPMSVRGNAPSHRATRNATLFLLGICLITVVEWLIRLAG